MTLHIVGGVYRERCIHPHWNEIYGSAGRAALAIATLGTPVVLHSYLNDDALQIMSQAEAWLSDFKAIPTKVPSIVSFEYLHDMAAPEILGVPRERYPPLRLSEENVIRFGMLEGDAIVHAEWAVYDPQNVHDGVPFGANGSTAKHLALVLNASEASHMAGIPGAAPSKAAPILAKQQGAEVVVVKMGAEGALVFTSSEMKQIRAYRTNHVWKIGSGDCFVANFANAWMHDHKTPMEAAEISSRATAYYCETRGFPSKDTLATLNFPAVKLSDAYLQGACRKVYLAGPFFDLAQVWLVQQTCAALRSMGLQTFSPYHDVGLGSAEDVVAKDIEGIRASDLVFAIADGLDAGTLYEIGYARALNKPVVVYSERQKSESMKMMEGSGCIICSDYTTALYSTLWEAVRI